MAVLGSNSFEATASYVRLHLSASHFLLALDVPRFMELDTLFERTTQLATGFHETLTGEGIVQALPLGELGPRLQEKRVEEGILYHAGICAPIAKPVRELGVAPEDLTVVCSREER